MLLRPFQHSASSRRLLHAPGAALAQQHHTPALTHHRQPPTYLCATLFHTSHRTSASYSPLLPTAPQVRTLGDKVAALQEELQAAKAEGASFREVAQQSGAMAAQLSEAHGALEERYTREAAEAAQQVGRGGAAAGVEACAVGVVLDCWRSGGGLLRLEQLACWCGCGVALRGVVGCGLVACWLHVGSGLSCAMGTCELLPLECLMAVQQLMLATRAPAAGVGGSGRGGGGACAAAPAA